MFVWFVSVNLLIFSENTERNINKFHVFKKLINKLILEDFRAEDAKVLPSLKAVSLIFYVSISDELAIVKSFKDQIAKQFATKVEVLTTKQTDNPKKHNAIPMKPAIFVE